MKNKTGTILRLIKKNFEDEELAHELFLITRQITKIRNDFAKNMLTDIKLSKAQICKDFAKNMSTDIKLSKAKISKIIQSGGFYGSWLAHLGKKR